MLHETVCAEGNKIPHGLIASRDTDEQDCTPKYQQDKGGTDKHSTAGSDVFLYLLFFFLRLRGAEGG